MQRNAGLDVVRLLAFFLVLGRHLHLPSDVGNFFLRAWENGGWMGIDLFFVLSGFLVSGTIFREQQKTGNIRIGQFLLRRAVKIYPAFYVFLLISLGIAHGSGTELSMQRVLGEFFFLQNYAGNVLGHTWSLAVEEHFYLGLAFAFWLWLKWRTDASAKPGFVVPLFFGIAVFCLFSRLLDGEAIKTHNRMDALFFGVLLAYLVHYKGLLERLERIPSFVLVGAGALIVFPGLVLPPASMLGVGLTTNYLGAGLIILGSVRMAPCIWLSSLATATYSMYLWHMSANAAAQVLVPSTGSWLLYILTYVGLAVGLGYLMYMLVERPATRLFKERRTFSPVKNA